jgi:hypothetical protein
MAGKPKGKAKFGASLPSGQAPTDDELAVPDLDQWPGSWRCEGRDVSPGQQMVERFKPFLRHLLSLSLSRKTLHKHRDNLRISDVPDAKAQKNFTDPESRIMKSKDGFVQAYNAQIAVDADAQIIVAHYVTQNGNDNGQLVPLIDAVEANLGRKPREVSADNGYHSEINLAALEERDIDGYVGTGRARDAAAGKAKAKAGDAAEPAEIPVHVDATQAQENTGDCGQPTTDVELSAGSQANDHAVDMATGQAAVAGDGEVAAAQKPTRVEAMRAKIKAGGRQSPYRLRKQVVEPVFGQIKEAGGFRQFLLRGIENVSGEWAMKATAHNILKLADKILNPAGEVLKPARRRTLSTGSQMAQAMP